MIKQYIKQAIGTLRENPLTGIISILGTALSVAMILVIVLQFQIRMASFEPVVNRSRTLFISSSNARAKDGSVNNNTGLSYDVARECLYSLKSTEAVSIRVANSLVISVPGRRMFDEYTVYYTDPAFWKMFDFRFLHGKPFTEADFQSGIPSVVISDHLARRLYNTTDAVGRDLLFNGLLECRVAGVVERPSRAANEAFADVWIPYTTNNTYTDSRDCNGMCGSFAATLLLHRPSDADAVYNEILQQVAHFNQNRPDFVLTIPRPLSTKDRTLGAGDRVGDGRGGWLEYFKTTGLVVLFLLLVPTLNLTGIVQSSVQKRRSEMGLRKAFGATGGSLFVQVVSENLVITLIGGLLGIGLSVLLLYAGRSFLLSADTEITFGMVFQPLLFAAALFFTLLLNLLSAGLPARRIAREQIIESLKDETK